MLNFLRNFPGSGTIVSFQDEEYNILQQYWTQSKMNEHEEKLKILKNAATIVRNDILQKVYDTNSYPPSDSILEEIDNLIPESLRYLVDEIV